MNSYQKNVIVGAFVIVALLAFGGGTLWLRGKSLGKADVDHFLVQGKAGRRVVIDHEHPPSPRRVKPH